MNANELRKILAEVKNERRGGTPHEAWVKQNRDILMMQVRNTTDLTTKRTAAEYMGHLFDIFMPVETFAMAARAIGIFFLVIGTMVGGGLVSAQAYGHATPGDNLYKVKLAVEDLQLFLAPTEDYRTRLHTEFADHRLDEVAKLAEGSVAKQELATVALKSFDREVAALRLGLTNLKTANPENIAETAKLMERRMAVYQGILRQAGAVLPPSVQPALHASRDLVDGVTIAAMAVIVEKHLAGDVNAPQNVVDNKFADRIKQAEAQLDSALAKGDGGVTTQNTAARAKLAEVKEFISAQNYQAALTGIVEVAELTKEVEQAAEAAQAAQVAPVAPTEADAAETKVEENLNQVQPAVPAPAELPVKTDDAAGSGNR